MKKTAIFLLALAILVSFSISASAADHYVVKGDTMWKISRAYGVSLDDLIKSNPQIKNPDLIYPGDLLYVPTGDETSYSQNGQFTSRAQSILNITNQNRANNGLKALKLDADLCAVAQAKADDMAQYNYFSHTSPNYGSPSEMLTKFGISYWYMGENIAKGYQRADAVMNGWMNSSGHRANILNGSFTKLGVGYNANGNIWVQMFVG